MDFGPVGRAKEWPAAAVAATEVAAGVLVKTEFLDPRAKPQMCL